MHSVSSEVRWVKYQRIENKSRLEMKKKVGKKNKQACDWVTNESKLDK